MPQILSRFVFWVFVTGATLVSGCSLRGCSKMETLSPPEPSLSVSASGPITYEFRDVVPHEDAFPKGKWTFPRLTGGGETAAREAVNLELDQMAAEFGCIKPSDQDGAEPLDERAASFEVVSKVLLADHGLFSIEYTANWECPGTAHASRGRFGATFELKKGERLTFNALLSADAEKAKEAWAMFFEDALAKAKQQEECKEYFEAIDIAAIDDVKFSLTANEVRAWIEAPHAMRACDIEGNVTYQSLKPYLRLDGPLNSLLTSIP